MATDIGACAAAFVIMALEEEEDARRRGKRVRTGVLCPEEWTNLQAFQKSAMQVSLVWRGRGIVSSFFWLFLFGYVFFVGSHQLIRVFTLQVRGNYLLVLRTNRLLRRDNDAFPSTLLSLQCITVVWLLAA